MELWYSLLTSTDFFLMLQKLKHNTQLGKVSFNTVIKIDLVWASFLCYSDA